MVEIINQQNSHQLRTGHFRWLLIKLLSFYGLGHGVVTLVFTTKASILRLNRRFRHKDRPTDVLSFPLSEKGTDGRFYVGDIVICVSQAYVGAGRNKANLEAELERLIIHGFLHLLGFNHGSEMKREEERLRFYLKLK
jgi:probable rRNA maturation factor